MASENRSEMEVSSPLLRHREAAVYLKVSSSTLYALIANDRIQVVRFGLGPCGRGITRFRRDDLDAFLAASAE